jgi:nucleoside phosphorylase
MTLVVFALKQEAKDFVRWMAAHPQDVRVEFIGVGAESVRRTLPLLIEKLRPETIIAAGFAGALTEEWKIGDVVRAKNFSTVEIASIPNAILHSSLNVVDEAGERAALAQTGASCIDMESATVAEITTKYQVSLLVLRAFSDTPDAPIPVPFAVSYDLERQKIRMAATIFWLMTHPQHWKAFIEFLGSLRKARQTLTSALIQSLNAMEPN